MTSLPSPTKRRSARATALAVTAAGLSAGLALALPGTAVAATAVPLGTAGAFVVLAGSGITNTGPTTLNGDLGTFPTTSITGTSTLTVNGTNHGGDAVTQGAKSDLVSAYNAAAADGPTTPVVADLGGKTLGAGVYNSASSIGLTGTLTLDGAGDANAIFVFQAGSTLTTASGSRVLLTNGAQACNVFWQVGSSATLGTGSGFVGSILALQSITVTTGTTVSGRVLARNGAVTLDTNTITRPSCAAAVAASPTPSPAASAAPTAVPSATPLAGPVTSPGTGTGGSSPAASPTRSAAGSPARSTPSAPSGAAPLAPAAPGAPLTGGNQVSLVPSGGVRTGDGSTLTKGSAPAILGWLGGLTGVLLLALVVGLPVSRRRRNGHS